MSRKWGFVPLFAAGLVAASIALPAASAFAQGTNPPLPSNPLIVIIDYNRILQETTAAKGLAAAADKYERGLNDDGSKLQADLQAQQRQIADQRASLSQQDFEKKARDFDQNAAQQQNNLLLRRRGLQEAEAQMEQKLRNAIGVAAQKVAGEKGASFVTMNSQGGPWLLYDQNADITTAVIAEMNKATPTIDFPPPAAPTAGSASARPGPTPAPKIALPQSKAAAPKLTGPGATR